MIAGNARKEIEEQSGRPIITAHNAAQLNTVVTNMIEGVAEAVDGNSDEEE